MDAVRSFSSLASLSEAAASELLGIASQAIKERSRFILTLSGGETPKALYGILANQSLDWQHVHLFWGDERYVPHDDPASNYRMAKESLIDCIDIPKENIHPIPTNFPNPEDAASQYERELRTFFGEEAPQFDLILLGLGNDGHTASLFPGEGGGDAARHADGLVIVTKSPKPPVTRISLSLRVINNARNVFFLVAGSDKASILKAVLDDRSSGIKKYPADFIESRGQVVWFVDKATNL